MSSESENMDAEQQENQVQEIQLDILQENETEENLVEDMEVIESTEKMWELLPSIPLQKIYSYVSRRDQTNMSLVCKRWSQEFGAPCVWKSIKFYFPERNVTEDVYPVVKFARRYGHMFRHVEIICRRVVTWMLNTISTQFHSFLEAISEKSELHSISFYNLKSYFRWLDDDARENALNAIAHLLGTQSQLRYVELNTCDFRKMEATFLLDSLFLRSYSPVKKLRLKKLLCDTLFDNNEESDEEVTVSFMRLRWIFFCFMRIEEWNGNYGDLIEDILIEFPNLAQEYEDLFHCNILERGSLKKMVIKYEGRSGGEIRGIPPESWKLFTRFCPKLEVDFLIGSTNNPNTVQLLLPRCLPLRSLDYRPVARNNANNETYSTAQLFSHIVSCQLNATLQELHLIWLTTSVNLVEELDDFVRRCPMLKLIEIQITYPLLMLENLFQSWIRDCPKSIQTVFITVSNIPSEEAYTEMDSLADNYIPVLQVLGVNFGLLLETADFR